MNASDGLLNFGEWNEITLPPRSSLFRPEPHGLGKA